MPSIKKAEYEALLAARNTLGSLQADNERLKEELQGFKDNVVLGYRQQVDRISYLRDMKAAELEEVCKMNEALRKENADLRMWLRELDDARDEAKSLRRAIDIERLRYAQYKQMLETYQNLLVDSFQYSLNPPVYIMHGDKVEIPKCLKPFDAIEYIARICRGEQDGPDHTPQVVS